MADVQDKLAKRAADAGGLARRGAPQSIAEFFSSPAVKNELERALPQGMSADRLLRVALTQIRLNPKLGECNVPSLAAALLQSAQLGLEPGVLGQAYLVPYWNKRSGTFDCTFLIGYRGMIDLARRSGQISSIYAHVVYERDQFQYELGLDPILKHVPSNAKDKGEKIGAYMVARFKDGGFHVEFMSTEEIYLIRARSHGSFDSQGRLQGPWATDEDAMFTKTVIKRAFKYLPVRTEDARAVQGADETVKAIPVGGKISENFASDMPDVSEHDDPMANVDLDTGEVIEAEVEEEPPGRGSASGGRRRKSQVQVEVLDDEELTAIDLAARKLRQQAEAEAEAAQEREPEVDTFPPESEDKTFDL